MSEGLASCVRTVSSETAVIPSFYLCVYAFLEDRDLRFHEKDVSQVFDAEAPISSVNNKLFLWEEGRSSSVLAYL